MSSFSEEMTIFIRLFQLFGLYPSNLLLKIYSMFNLFITVVIFFSAFFIFHVLEDDNSLSLLVGGLVFVGILMTQMMNTFQAYFSRNEQSQIYQKFDEIDLLLSNNLLVSVNYKNVRRRLIIKYTFIGIVLAVIHITSIISVTVNHRSFNYYVHLILPVAVIRFRCIQNMFYVDLINSKLQSMNHKLTDIIQHKKDKMSYILFADRLQKHDKFNAKHSCYDQLMTLKQIYGKIFDVCNLINDVFGWSLLFIVWMNIIALSTFKDSLIYYYSFFVSLGNSIFSWIYIKWILVVFGFGGFSGKINCNTVIMLNISHNNSPFDNIIFVL